MPSSDGPCAAQLFVQRSSSVSSVGETYLFLRWGTKLFKYQNPRQDSNKTSLPVRQTAPIPMSATAQDGAGADANLPGRGRLVLVTGGAGYIGSHCVLQLLQVGYNVVVIDNFCNSVGVSGETPVAPSLSRVEKITGKKVILYQCDLLDKEKLDVIFSKHPIDCVIHFAAKKSVAESMRQPILYYRNNVCGTIGLLEVMRDHGVKRLVFSSSCTVYGDPEHLPISEEHPISTNTNVYGKTKMVVEDLLQDIVNADRAWNVIALRYFNPVGAHPSGLIGEDPAGGFSNIVPIIGEVLAGKKKEITVFGSDYNTPDGTGVRDYIHVMDLAIGHVAALNKLYADQLHYRVYNLGTGRGISVLELLRAFETATGRPVPYEMQGRRQGDIVAMYADTKRAEKELGWTAKRSLQDMCNDFWRWKTMNPEGYRTDAAFGGKINGSSHVNGNQVNGKLSNGHSNGGTVSVNGSNS